MELMHSNKLSSGDGFQSTQKYVDVDEIKEGIIILKNRSYRAVVMVSAVNFDLMSNEEQDTIVSQYQNFLNSLDFPVQILIASRRVNIEPYFEYLDRQEKQTMNELMSFQISEYRKFVKSLTEVSNVMTKFFYIVVPFYGVENVKKGLLENIIKTSKKGDLGKKESFQIYKNQIFQRVDQVTVGLSAMGLKVTPLKTEELIELMYNSYNPVVDHTALIRGIDKIELN